MTAFLLALVLAAAPSAAPTAAPVDPFVSSWNVNADIVSAYADGTDTKAHALVAVARIHLDRDHECYWTRLAAITMLREVIFAWETKNISVFSSLNAGISALIAGEADGCVAVAALE